MKKPALTVGITKPGRSVSTLVDGAAKGEPFVIAKAGTPMVQVSAWRRV
jgi:antitoxin (DNA-binding transcriptional repressor) of toxin-antitoxin stability system